MIFDFGFFFFFFSLKIKHMGVEISEKRLLSFCFFMVECYAPTSLAILTINKKINGKLSLLFLFIFLIFQKLLSFALLFIHFTQEQDKAIE